MKINVKKIVFLLAFVGLGLIALQIPLFQIRGAKQAFTLFDFWGPTIGMFLSSGIGLITVIIVKLVSTLITHQPFDLLTVIRFFPLALGAFYLANRSRKILIIPIVCIILFIAHPEGRAAWYYSLYWLIPLFAFWKKDRLIINSLGSTFTAHAIGSVAFLYALNLPSVMWISLIPQVFIERVTLAVGMWLSYLVLNTILAKIENAYDVKILKHLVNNNYILSRNFFKHFA